MKENFEISCFFLSEQELNFFESFFCGKNGLWAAVLFIKTCQSATTSKSFEKKLATIAKKLITVCDAVAKIIFLQGRVPKFENSFENILPQSNIVPLSVAQQKKHVKEKIDSLIIQVSILERKVSATNCKSKLQKMTEQLKKLVLGKK